MRTSHGRLFVLSGLIATAVLAGSFAAGRRSATPPMGLATIDIQKVFMALNERRDGETTLTAYKDGLVNELKSFADQAKGVRAAAEAMQPGPARDEEMRKAMEMEISFSVKEKFFPALIDRKQSEMFRAINDKILDASKRLAQRSGYSMVIGSDDGVKIPERASSDESQRIMSLKKFMYVAPEHDVSNDLIAMLNSEYVPGKR